MPIKESAYKHLLLENISVKTLSDPELYTINGGMSTAKAIDYGLSFLGAFLAGALAYANSSFTHPISKASGAFLLGQLGFSITHLLVVPSVYEVFLDKTRWQVDCEEHPELLEKT